MRIVAGRFRGRALAALGKGDAGAHLRPTTDRVRENLFNILAGGRFGEVIENARVLDVFAGTGALGLEALSRGAQHVTFIENGRVGQRLITQNIALCDAANDAKVLRLDATKLPANPDAPYDLIFLDPPYRKQMGEKAMARLIAGNWVAPDAFIVWEEAANIIAPTHLSHLDSRKYGETQISFYRLDETDPPPMG